MRYMNKMGLRKPWLFVFIRENFNAKTGETGDMGIEIEEGLEQKKRKVKRKIDRWIQKKGEF